MAGFQLIKTQGASGYAGKVQTFEIDSNDSNLMAIGDALVTNGTANANGLAQVIQADGGAGEPITGIIVGFEPDLSNLELKGRTASTTRIARLQVDPNALYEIEIGVTLTVASVGLNVLLTADAAVQSGNLVRSDMTTGAVSATGPLRVVGLVPVTDDSGDAIGAVGQKAIVSVILSTLTDTTGV